MKSPKSRRASYCPILVDGSHTLPCLSHSLCPQALISAYLSSCGRLLAPQKGPVSDAGPPSLPQYLTQCIQYVTVDQIPTNATSTCPASILPQKEELRSNKLSARKESDGAFNELVHIFFFILGQCTACKVTEQENLRAVTD